MNHFSDAEYEKVAGHFRLFAEHEAGSSPLYSRLAAAAADDHELLTVVMAAPPRQRIPNLLLAAVQRVLTEYRDDPLAAYYRSLGGTRAADDAAGPALRDFVLGHREKIEKFVATGDTQTNEVRRGAQLRPAFGWAHRWAARPLALIELGTSAGLLLHPDRYAYAYEYSSPAYVLEAGSSRLVLSTSIRGSSSPDALRPLVSEALPIASRLGIDLHPLDLGDPDAAAWLRALMWPDRPERLARLDAAIAIARQEPVPTITGDALEELPAALAGVGVDAMPCVFISNVLGHFTPEGHERFVTVIRELGSSRDFVLIIKEAARVGLGMFTDSYPELLDPPGVFAREALGIVTFRDGVESAFLLAECGLHGVWMDWRSNSSNICSQ